MESEFGQTKDLSIDCVNSETITLKTSLPSSLARMIGLWRRRKPWTFESDSFASNTQPPLAPHIASSIQKTNIVYQMGGLIGTILLINLMT